MRILELIQATKDAGIYEELVTPEKEPWKPQHVIKDPQEPKVRWMVYTEITSRSVRFLSASPGHEDGMVALSPITSVRSLALRLQLI